MTTPAEDLLRVERENVAKPNYDAYGAVTQTGPLQASDSLPAGFQKDATGRIFAIGTQTNQPVVTSTDGKAEFDKNKSEVDARQKAIEERTAADKAAADAAKAAAGAGGTGGGTSGVGQDDKDPRFVGGEIGRVEAGADPVADSLNAWEVEQREKFDQEAAKRKQEYENLFNTSLSAIDAATAATIAGINSSYARRLDEQRRINDINISRVKAYGLGHGGQFTPIDFSDAVSVREEEASAKIAQLEGERTSLISQANAAAQSGKTALLRDRMEDLAKVEEQLRINLNRVQDEADKQYEVLRTLRREQEQDHKDKLEEARKRFAAVASSFVADYDGKDQAGKDAIIRQIMTTTGLDYATVYSEMQKASQDAKVLRENDEDRARDEEDRQRDIAKDKRADLREVDGDLYSVKYDADGNPILKLEKKGKVKATGGSGGGGGGGSTTNIKLTPTDIKKMTAQGLDPNNADDKAAYIKAEYGDGSDGGKVLTFLEFEKLAAETVDENGKYLYNWTDKELQKKYDDYLAQANAGKVAKELTSTDRKKMAAQGLDPEDPQDVQTYIKKEYDPLK